MSSAICHVYPDNYVLHKMDHFAIVVLIVATLSSSIYTYAPVSKSMAPMFAGTVALFVSASLERTPRTIGFVIITAYILYNYRHQVFNKYMLAQACIYLLGAYLFVRNQGHDRAILTDHHIFHNLVTIACGVQFYNLASASTSTST